MFISTLSKRLQNLFHNCCYSKKIELLNKELGKLDLVGLTSAENLCQGDRVLFPNCNPQYDLMEHQSETIIFVPPDGGYGWVIVIVAFISETIIDGSVATVLLFKDKFAKEFGASIEQVLAISSVNMAFYFMFGPIASALLNKFGIRPVAFFGSLLIGAAYAGGSCMRGIPGLIATIGMLAGIGQCLVVVATSIVIGFYFDKLRALACGLYTCGTGAGQLMFPFLVSFILEVYTWQVAYWVMTVLFLINSLFACLYIPLKPITVKLVTSIPRRSSAQQLLLPQTSANINIPKASDVIDESDYIIYDVDDDEYTDDKESTVSNISTGLRKGSQRIGSVSKIVFGDEETIDKCCGRCRRCCTCYNYRNRHAQRPIYKDDIMYSQSTTLLGATEKLRRGEEKLKRQYRPSVVQYHMGVTRIRTDTDKKHFCVPIRRALATLLDFSLLKSLCFNIYAVTGTFYSMGATIPPIYVRLRALEYGFTEKESVTMLGVVGVGMLFGRLVGGILPSFCACLNAFVYTYISTCLCGVLTAISGFSYFMTFELQCGYCAVYGFCAAGLFPLKSVILVKLFTLQRLTSAFGLCWLYTGVGASLGPILSGVILETTKNIHILFYFSGCCFILCGIIHIFLKRLRNWEINRGILL